MSPNHPVRVKLLGDVPLHDLGARFADPLFHALQAQKFGDLLGGEGQYDDDGRLAWISIDLRLVDLDRALEFTRRTLQELGAPAGSELTYPVDGQPVTRPIDDPPAT